MVEARGQGPSLPILAMYGVILGASSKPVRGDGQWQPMAGSAQAIGLCHKARNEAGRAAYNHVMDRSSETVTAARVERWLVLADPRGPNAAAIRARLAEHGVSDARWYLPKDVEDLERDLAGAGTACVLAADAETLLGALFDGLLSIETWARHGVRIETIAPSPIIDDWNRCLPSREASVLGGMAIAWADWRQTQRRRRIAAGVILSIVAIAAATVVALL